MLVPRLGNDSVRDLSGVASELSTRLQADADHYGGVLPERAAIAWRGYLAAMLEWNLLSISQYDDLVARVPRVEDDPSIAILTGRD
jgi:hypothetical protein